MRQISDEEMDILRQLPANVSGLTEDGNAPTDKANQKETAVEETTIEEPHQEPTQVSEKERLASMLGQQVGYKKREAERSNEMQEEAVKNHMYIGANMFESADIKDGWQIVDRSLLGERNIYYPEDWEFRIKPATVEAIRSWSTIDDENPNVVDDVFNEIIKACFKISTPNGLIPWGNLRSWDRFFILLLIRQYTFAQGENKIQYTDDCPECDNSVTFVLDSTTIQYTLPDPEVMKYYDPETCTWLIDPAEYDVEGEVLRLYLPTLEKDSNIKAWVIDRLRNKKKVDPVFLKFLPWMAKSISKNEEVAARQIKELEMKFKGYDTEMFTFVNDVITNITVLPSTKLTTKCPTCGEEVTTDIRFPDGISKLFNIKRNGKKFGKK